MTNATKNKSVTYFIADLHLAQNRPDITACFLSFLEKDAPNAETLYILGDLFEYWIGDDDKNPFVVEVALALKTLSMLGTDIYYIHGNRDFLLGKRYAKACGMTLLPEVDVIDLYGKPVVIMHGDTLCTRDIAYQAFRKKSRSWWWQAIIKNLPLFVRKNIAENYRLKSASATAMKSQEIMDVTETEVIAMLELHHCQLLIHGHTHRPNIHHIQANNLPAQRIVLGDWYEQGAWLKVTRDSIELLSQAFKPH
ncbi:UDP-2,3-diacylglucosamine diphosphatase [Colwellia hornerae]|uniref:UDP-2,3-diacylglucosamine hydrolase n=1 Tax=Colwellia hornerae TaxID=89402 RepID=A0A5C6Q4R6_9GAMM|nr:UDP-2,3-diacylglucosamine diphosphatase [Colwellia hornerae]TWX48355.1 UDP-2,3-diacylglucosamine diphosphatase [Colwellia hornerae]TWX54934.1 UDP-2,3-diacylglucosamine diphosphatase [Colwellia hornerae]TWX63884.1 UDP-2,3-diacylglucosamine diphosphatase [Colwellia hornerae]